MSVCPMRPRRGRPSEPECHHFRADGEPLKRWEDGHPETEGIATCTYWGSGGGYALSCAEMYCGRCRHWRADALAHPESERPGSLRVCAIERITHAYSWCDKWEALTDEQRIEKANDAGRLF